jgi:exopolyphosphatase / guanosine-5'-triphosphate,3'-diphosphate pyrophosphatase
VTRVAAVDLGTNTTRLLVADVDDGAVATLDRREQITGLGEGVDARRRLLPRPIARVRNALTEYRRRIEELGAERALCVATSAVRDAENGEAFLGEIEWSYGFTTRLLTGEEEARLTFAGATLGRTEEDGVMVVDIGGGSTELVLRDREVSLDIGSVRLTEQLGENVDAIATAVTAKLPRDLEPQRAIGVAGTIMSLAALDLGLESYDRDRVHGHRLSADAVAHQVSALAALSLEERRQLPALDPKRAPVIVAGAVILREVLRHFRLDEIEASERDLLDGVALEAAHLPEPVEGDAPPGAYVCC